VTASAAPDAPHVCLTFWGNLLHDARVIRTASALVDAGARVTVVCTDTLGELAAHEQHPKGFAIRRVRRPSPRRMRLVDGQPVIGKSGALWAALRGALGQLRLARAAFATRADVYHAADLFPLLTTWLVASLRRRPVLYEAYEISTDREGLQPVVGLVRWLEGFIVRRVTAVFATTGMRADHFVREYGIERPRVLQNRPPYRPAVDSDRLRERCGLSEAEPIVLYQGGMQPGRGLFNLLTAAKQLRGAAVVLLGGGMLTEALRRRITELGVQDTVRMLPPVPADELHAWTCSADIGVQILENTCLNHYTTDSNKLFEYVMAGLPVVASDFPEIRAVVTGHDLGELVDPADVAAITAAIQRLVDDPELRAIYRGNALEAAPQLSWETQIPALLEAYQDLGWLRVPHALA
jgi:glycosyltransferase involved in cell wall biosynthesis